MKLKEMKKFNPNVKSSRLAQAKNKHSRHELTEDGEQAKSYRRQRHNVIDDIAMDFDDEIEFQEIKRYLK